MKYRDITIGDRSTTKRWLQRRRFHDALRIFRRNYFDQPPRVLDFGAGNGELILQMKAITPVQASVYEPTPSLMNEAKDNLKSLGSIEYFETLDIVEAGIFDLIFCLEVFEHLPDRETVIAISEIHRLLKPDGLAIIGVPHELFLPALIKGLFRMSRRYGDFDARPSNIFAAFCGHPPSKRPLIEISPGFPYHSHHLGFNFRHLEQLLQKDFRIIKKWFSPLPALGITLNSEVFFLLKKV